MITIIVPLDFSQTSLNAAHYAADMYREKSNVNLILYHFYTTAEEKSVADNYLSSLKQELSATMSSIETVVDSGNNFIDGLAAFSHVRHANMIVMGLTGKTPMAQRFSGSNTLKISEKDVCPVLIIPEHARYKGVHNVLIASEMKYVNESPALLAVKKVLEQFNKPNLHILNVDSSHYISLTADFKQERDKMETLLADFKPEFYFMRLFDFHESINLFTEDKHIDMIIIAPKHHSFYERLFKTQHTKTMIYQSKVPVLAVHE